MTMDGDQVGESPADDPAIPEWVSDPITWVARPSMPRGYIAAETAACVVVAFDIMRILRDNAKIRSEISVGPSLETWDLVDNGMTDRVWHPGMNLRLGVTERPFNFNFGKARSG
jgi:hypothetical protein